MTSKIQNKSRPSQIKFFFTRKKLTFYSHGKPMENNIPEQTLNEDSMLRPISIRPIMNAEGRIDDDQPVNESAGLWRDYREGELIDI